MIYKKTLKIKNRSYLKKNKKIKGGNGIYKTKCTKFKKDNSLNGNNKNILECTVKKNINNKSNPSFNKSVKINTPIKKPEQIGEPQENEKIFLKTNLNFFRNKLIDNKINSINYNYNDAGKSECELFIIINENDTKIRLLVKNKENSVLLNYNVFSNTLLIVNPEPGGRDKKFWLKGKENSRNNHNTRSNFLGEFENVKLNLEFQKKFNEAKELIFNI